VLYVERLSLVERVFRSALDDYGLEAELEVERFTLDGLTLGDVTLREDGPDGKVIVATARRVTAAYDFRDALNGKIRRVDVDGADIRVGLDEDFQIVDGWLRPSGDGGSATLPSQGIGITDSHLSLTTPFGDARTAVSGEVASLERFDLALALEPASFTRDDLSLTIAGQADAARSGNTLTLDGTFTLPQVAFSEISATNGTLTLDGTFDIPTRTYAGDLATRFANGTALGGTWSDLAVSGVPIIDLDARTLSGPLSAKLASLAASQATATGVALDTDNADVTFADTLRLRGAYMLSADTAKAFEMQARDLAVNADLETLTSGTAQIEAANFAFLPTRARSLAASLTLADILSASPVARDFAPILTRDIADTLQGGALSAKLDVSIDELWQMTLLGPATLRGAQTLRLTPDPDTPTYSYDPVTDQLGLALDAALTGSRALRATRVRFGAISSNGLTPDAVTAFSARLRTNAWTATTASGAPTSLTPLDVQIDSGPGSTTLTGALGFTGDIPGGYVTNLRTDGRLDITPGGRLTLDYASESPITFDRLALPSGGSVEDFSATLISSEDVFAGDANDGDILATLANADLTYLFTLSDGTPEIMDITAAEIIAQGKIVGDLAGKTQNWALSLTDAQLYTDTFIGEGTTATVQTAELTAQLVPDRPLGFTFDTPSLNGKTEIARARDMPISAAGTLNDFEAEFGPGRLRSSDERLPVGRVAGTAIFRNGEWVGESTATLPNIAGGQSAPLLIDFQFRDGAGEADIRFKDLVFDPDEGLQPQDYVGALRGKISQVRGAVDGRFRLGFGVGLPLESSGYVELKGLDLATAPGPARGIRTRVEFTSLFPLESSGRQMLTLDSFDPGLPLENGTFEYELIPEGIRIHSASWPLGDGRIALEPLTWEYAAALNTAVLVIDGVGMDAFLDALGQDAVEITGVLKGRLPVEIRGVNVEVRGGRLDVTDGGVIRYETPQTDTVAAANELAQVAFEALREFNYTSLGVGVDGPLDGDITVELSFAGGVGKTVPLPLPKWVRLSGDIPFIFNISVTGQLFNILKSLDPGQYTDSDRVRGLITPDPQDPDPQSIDGQPALMQGSGETP